MKFLGIFYILFTLGAVRLSRAEFEPAYLKVCGKHEKYEVNSKVCPKGVWLKHPIQPGCLCIHGVWALNNGYCDDNAVIIVGEGHCFHVPFEIRSAILIGDPADPFKPIVYSTPSTLDAIYEVGEKGYTPKLLRDSSLVVAINPRQVAQRADFAVCLDLPPSGWNNPVHIYENPRRSDTEWTLNTNETFECSVTKSYTYHLGFGDMYSKNRVDPKELVERNCIKDCPQEHHSHPLGRSLTGTTKNSSGSSSTHFQPRLASTSNTSWDHEKPVYTNSKTVKYFKPQKTQEEINREKVEARARVVEEDDAFTRETNEQTLRMMHAHVSPILLNITGPTIKTREYQYFQIMRQVVERACPNDFVPKPFLRGLMRMFRQLLWESQESFTHSESGDDEQHKRTLDLLAYCSNMTDDPAILFSDLTSSYSSNSSDPSGLTHAWANLSDLPPERCPNPFIFSINATTYNRTHYDRVQHEFLKNISQYPPTLKYNVTDMDFIIETAWKVVVMGHYRCSKYFNSSSYSDYSNVFYRMSSFFNKKILRRWYHIPSSLPTYEVVKLMFPAYDLRKFAFGMDACHLGIKQFSDFDTQHWIRRPKYPTFPEDLTNKEIKLSKDRFRDNHLSTFDYAPNPPWPNPFFDVDKSKYPATSRSKRRRRKRYSSSQQPVKFHLWDNQSTCIQNYLEPLAKPFEFNYNIPSGCVAPDVNAYIVS